MRRHKRMKEEAELNVTSFMNLMIVLVPVLLMNMVFSQLAVLDLRLPSGDQPESVVNPEDVTLNVVIRSQGFEITRTYQQQTESLLSLPKSGAQFDFDALSLALQDIKKNPGFAGKKRHQSVVLAGY